MEENVSHMTTTEAGLTARQQDEASGLIGTVSTAVEGAAAAAGREIKRGYEAAGELVEETAQCVGHYPLSAVALAFGGGVLVGLLLARSSGPRLSRLQLEER